MDESNVQGMVVEAQRQWAEALIKQDVDKLVSLYETAGPHWTHEESPEGVKGEVPLAFNPTLEDKFVSDEAGCVKYFKGTDEKPGFARQKWLKVYFDPKEHPSAVRFITLSGELVVAVGRYVFYSDPKEEGINGKSVLVVTQTIVDYTFVYRKTQGGLKIIAHHSSLPISQKAAR